MSNLMNFCLKEFERQLSLVRELSDGIGDVKFPSSLFNAIDKSTMGSLCSLPFIIVQPSIRPSLFSQMVRISGSSTEGVAHVRDDEVYNLTQVPEKPYLAVNVRNLSLSEIAEKNILPCTITEGITSIMYNPRFMDYIQFHLLGSRIGGVSGWIPRIRKGYTGPIELTANSLDGDYYVRTTLSCEQRLLL